MFANCQKGGTNLASPDVCKTPMGNSTPPIPYPNIVQGATANPGTAAKKVLISGTPGHTLQTVIPMSSGDNAGVCGGVMSGGVMGPSRHLKGADNVLIGGSPATKMTDPTGQNGSSQNVPGSTIAPAQMKVMITKGNSDGGAASTSRPATSAKGVASPAQKSDPALKPAPAKKEKVPVSNEVAVRIGVFFDGTGNNMENDTTFKKLIGEDTNVVRLYELYNGNPDRTIVAPVGKLEGLDLFAFKHYVNGVGTKDGREKPSDLEMGTGAGVVTRINNALRWVRGIFAQFVGRDGPRIVDVFGFSRGSSTARDFINQINKYLSSDGVEVRFVGIYDTVASFGLAGNNINYRSDLPLIAEAGSINPFFKMLSSEFKLDLRPHSAKQIFHLTAADEKRVNFPLNSLKSAENGVPPANTVEVKVIGVHADVGGGYDWSPMEEIDRVSKHYLRYRPGFAGEQTRMLEEKRRLQERGAREGLELVADGSESTSEGEVTDIYWLARCRKVKPGLSIVYLHWMHDKAKKAELPLFDIEEFVRNKPRRFAIPNDLSSLFEKDLATCVNPEKVRHEYVHASHREWEDRDAEHTWIANRPTSEDKRQIFYNDPNKAVMPKPRKKN